MAKFLVLSYEHTAQERLPQGHDYFRDDDGTTFEKYVDAAASVWLASGYPDGYRPGSPATAVGFGIVLLIAVPSRYPGWLQIAVLAWMAVAVAWYAYWLGRLTAQGPGCAVERIPVDDVWTPSASDGKRR